MGTLATTGKRLEKPTGFRWHCNRPRASTVTGPPSVIRILDQLDLQYWRLFGGTSRRYLLSDCGEPPHTGLGLVSYQAASQTFALSLDVKSHSLNLLAAAFLHSQQGVLDSRKGCGASVFEVLEEAVTTIWGSPANLGQGQCSWFLQESSIA